MGFVQYVYRIIIVKVFRLTDWQLLTLDDKEYARNTIRRVNAIIKRDRIINGNVVELGCGMGDIITGISSTNRIGIDINNRNIMAARLFHLGCGRRVRFVHGGFEKIDGMNIDFLIIVNVLHNIPYDTVKNEMNRVIKNNDIEYIVIDEVRDSSANEYKYEHNGVDLFGSNGYKKTYMGKRFGAAGKAYRRVVIYKRVRKIEE